MDEEQAGQGTIVTDVTGTEVDNTPTNEGQAEQRTPTQREIAMQEILAGRLEQDDLAGDNEVIQQATTQQPLITVDSDEVLLKVDGVEVKTSKDKVFEAGKRSLQKESSADRRLKEAAEKEAQLNALAQELARMEQDLLTKRNQQEDIEPDETGKKFADALFTDEDVVAKTITSITKQLREVSSKVDAVQRTEESKKQDAFKAIVQHYHTNYNDIANDEDMHFALNRIKKEVSVANPALSQTQVIDEAAKRVYQKFNIDKIAPAPTDRIQAKQRMPAPIRKASARVEQKPVEKPKTPSEVLDGLRLNRGPRPY